MGLFKINNNYFKIKALPNGEPIMSGEGHKDWVSGIDFHPRFLNLTII